METKVGKGNKIA